MLCPRPAVYWDLVSLRLAYVCAALLVATAGSACSCGDGTDCGPGTIEFGGECVPGGPDAGNGECGPGTIPSEQGCVPAVSPADRRPCEGRFGPIAEDDADAVFVDASFDGDNPIGTADAPYTSIQDAIDAASAGSIVAVAAGTYTEDIAITKPLALEGRCAREAIIEGGVAVSETGDVAVRGFTIASGSPGISAVNAQPISQEFGLEIRFILLTQSQGAGILMDNSVVSILDSDVFMTTALAGELETFGSGIVILNGSIFDIGASIVQMNGFKGIDVTDAFGQPIPVSTLSDNRSSGTIRDSQVRGNMAGGIRLRSEFTGDLPPPDDVLITIQTTTIADNAGDGIAANASRIDVVGSAIRNNNGHGISATSSNITVAGNDLQGKAQSGVGVYLVNTSSSVSANSISSFDKGGIAVMGEPDDGVGGALVFGNTLEMNAETGILLMNVDDATVEGNEVSGTVPSRTPDQSGHGIWVDGDPDSEESQVSVRNNFVHDNGGIGISVANFARSQDIVFVDAFKIENNTVDDNGFAGINLQQSDGGTVEGNTIRRNGGYGIRSSAIASLASTLRVFILDNDVEDTAVSFLNNDGDGIFIVDSHVTTNLNRVSDSARHGIFAANECSGGIGDPPGPGTDNTVTGSGGNDKLQQDISGGLAFPGAAVGSGEVVNGASFGFNPPPPLQ